VASAQIEFIILHCKSGPERSVANVARKAFDGAAKKSLKKVAKRLGSEIKNAYLYISRKGNGSRLKNKRYGYRKKKFRKVSARCSNW
jgi:hypothetical protein